MTRPAWSRVKQIFERASGLAGTERAAFLAAATADDGALRAEVEELLAASDSASDFLEDPPIADGNALYAALASSWAVGREVGPWRITRLLGHGGSGVVHLAERARGGPTQRVALKLLRPGADSLDGIRRLMAEAQTLARLDHPGVARLIDGGSTPEGLPWLAMEFVDGAPIDVHCDREVLSVRERLALVIETARIVGDLHREGLVHRDLKPGNLFVDRRGRPRVLDLGLARWLDTGTTATATRARRLTPSCAAPEQIRGGAVSPATDVFALGVLLSRLLIDAPPWHPTMTEAALLAAICDGPLVPPSRRLDLPRAAEIAARRDTDVEGLRLALGARLDRVVLACLERDPAARYADGHALADDLERLLADEEPSARLRLSTLDRRAARRLGVAAMLVTTLLATLGGWVLERRARIHAEERAAALARVITAGAAAGDPATCAALAEAAALGRDLGHDLPSGCDANVGP